MTERELLVKYADEGDPQAFCQLSQQYSGMVYSICRRILTDPASAEDAAQETFLELARHASNIRGRVGTWLHQVATRKCLDSLRARSRRQHHERNAANLRPAHADQELPWAEFSTAVDGAIEELPNDLKDMLIACYLKGETQRCVGERYGIAQQTVSARLDSAVEKLRTILKKKGLLASAVTLTGLLVASSSEAAPAVLLEGIGRIATSGVGSSAVAGVTTGSAGVASNTAAGGGAFSGGISGLKLGIAAVCVAGAVIAISVALQRNASKPTVPPPPAPLEREPAVEVPVSAPTQRPGDLIWTQQVLASDDQYCSSIAPLPEGGVVLTGWFAGTATFGPGEDHETELHSAGLMDMCIAKYDSEGKLVWAKSSGAANWDEGLSVATYPDGRFLVTGFFQDSVTFGQGEPNEATLIAEGSQATSDIFVAKYNADGTLTWATRAGGTGDGDWGISVATLPDGGGMVLGQFIDNAMFGPGESNQTMLRGGGMFLARFAPDGALTWARHIGIPIEWPHPLSCGIVVCSDGTAIIGGSLLSEAVLAPGEINETRLVAERPNSVFLAKYDGRGRLLWAITAGGGGKHGFGVAAMPDGGAVAAGSFSDVASFGPVGQEPMELVSEGGTDVFVARYDADGALVWARRAGGFEDDRVYSASASADGHIAVTGAFGGVERFEPRESTGDIMMWNRENEHFTAQYSADGTALWTERARLRSQGEPESGVAILPDNTTVVGGSFVNEANFNPDGPQSTIRTSYDGNSIFVAKYSGAVVNHTNPIPKQADKR